MKKITFLLAFVATTLFAGATVYLDETFNYADGALKNAAGWSTGGSTTWTSDYMVQSPALNYTNTGGTFILSGVGKQMNCNYISPYGSSNYTVFKSFTETAITAGEVYVSFLYSPNNVSQSQSQAPAMSISVPGTNTGVQVWVGKGVLNTSDFRFGTTRGSTTGADIKWAATEYSDLSAVFLVVLKYNLDTQTSSIFVNPTVGSTTEPTPDAVDATSTSSVRTSVQTIQFKTQGSSKEVYVASSVRVSSTWSEAVAAQPVSTSVDNISGKLSLYAHGSVISSNIAGQLEVFNLQGASVLKANIQNELNTGLNPGLYLVRFTTTDNRAVTTKIIIR